MDLDVRIPIGFLFAIIGGLLAGYGVFGDKVIYARSLGINVNLWWGLAMLFTGCAFLWFSWRSAKSESSGPN